MADNNNNNEIDNGHDYVDVDDNYNFKIKERTKDITLHPAHPPTHRAGLKPIRPIASNWAPRPILQTLVQVDWEPGPTEIVPNWVPHPLRPALPSHIYICIFVLPV